MALDAFNIDQGYGVFSKENYETAKHSHYAIEIVRCIEGSFNIITESSKYTNIKGVIIPPNLIHSFNCKEAKCELLFLDPLSDIGMYFMQAYDLVSRENVIVDPQLNQYYKNGKFDISSMLNSAGTITRRNFDFRILKCINTINSFLKTPDLTLSQLSEASFLSESRLSHLFRKQVGISIHQCILWKKILHAVSKSREGYSLTECAHFAGFVDSAHFS